MAEQNLKALKTLVISMGIVMMVGMIVVAAAVAMKMKPGASAVQCAGGEVNLTGRGHVVDTNYHGNTLRVILAKPSGEIEVAQIDLCSGKPLSSLKITTDGLPEAAGQ